MKKQFLEEGTVSTLPHTDARRNEANPVGPHLQRHRWEARRFFCIFTLAVEEMVLNQTIFKKIQIAASQENTVQDLNLYLILVSTYRSRISVKKGPG